MELSTVLAFAGVAAMLIVVPGPDWAFVVAAGVRERVVLSAVTGLIAGYALLTVVVAAGVGPLVAHAPLALTGLGIVGATYLIHLGLRALRTSGAARPHGAEAAITGRVVRRGIGVSALNPKGLLFFVVLLPQFARPADSWPLPVQLAALGGVWAMICAAFYTALGFAADRVFATRPGLARVVTRVAGAAMILVGIALLGEQLLRR